MTATDELRQMLTEADVEWKEYGYENHTWWNGSENVGWHAENRPSVTGSYVKVEAVLTPAQAIAATVGRGTCEADETETIKCWVKCKDEPSTERMELIHVMECSECGHTYEHVNGDYEFCPRCGRKRADA